MAIDHSTHPTVDPPGHDDSPHLVAATDGAGTAVIADAGARVIDIAVRGPWSQELCEQVSAVLRRCSAGAPSVLVLDLQHLADPYGASTPFWLTAWRQARAEPAPVQLVLALPATAALSRRLRLLPGPQPRLFATLSEAHVAVADRPARSERLRAGLPPRPVSIRAARGLVRQACIAWRLPDLLADASLVVSELATNAVQHAGTPFVVTVARAGSRLHVAVRDGDPAFPRPAVPAGPGVRGRGLRLVHTVATAWGALPARGGKVVWATVG